jgi:hypothetical protein
MIKLKVNTLELYRLWRSPLRNDELCDRLGVPRGSLWHLRQRHKLPPRPSTARVPGGKERDAPTPEQIAERAAAIRAAWPEGEAERRMVGRRAMRWRMPAYAFAHRDCAFTEISVD